MICYLIIWPSGIMGDMELDIKFLEARAGMLEDNLKVTLNLIQQLVNQIEIMNNNIIDLNGRVIELELKQRDKIAD